MIPLQFDPDTGEFRARPIKPEDTDAELGYCLSLVWHGSSTTNGTLTLPPSTWVPLPMTVAWVCTPLVETFTPWSVTPPAGHWMSAASWWGQRPATGWLPANVEIGVFVDDALWVMPIASDWMDTVRPDVQVGNAILLRNTVPPGTTALSIDVRVRQLGAAAQAFTNWQGYLALEWAGGLHCSGGCEEET